MKRTRLSDEIAEKIKNLVLEGAWVRGQRLPAERELADSFGVSRPSLREAIRSLVATGLLHTHHGGGTYVAETVGASFRDPLQQVLFNNPDAQRDLLEFRYMLEGTCSYYAALRATAADRTRLTQAFETLASYHDDPVGIEQSQEQSADAHFHLVIAEASHNAILLHTMRNTYEVLGSGVQVNFAGMYPDGHGVRGDLMKQHQALYLAIMEGRADDASDAAQSHIRFVQEVLLEMKAVQEREARSLRRGLML
ncbi:GntR family transcriptional regulator [Paenalcaligenes niemegkensis]|uniref:GntR family transcriptional regulator n=1 Tax=Paenalcaligenes niemegkensis TaxID=2895469 RepID=UPI001EE8D72D|nr:GntR family transcriptional regulator [Paenalcaligenes niemegkensis]MCQ9618195.1 GntR family transcriptional regulator [Paenalcaligenes niemegkensis]